MTAHPDRVHEAPPGTTLVMDDVLLFLARHQLPEELVNCLAAVLYLANKGPGILVNVSTADVARVMGLLPAQAAKLLRRLRHRGILTMEPGRSSRIDGEQGNLMLVTPVTHWAPGRGTSTA